MVDYRNEEGATLSRTGLGVYENILALLDRSHYNTLNKERSVPSVIIDVLLKLFVEIHFIVRLDVVFLHRDNFDLISNCLSDSEFKTFNSIEVFSRIVIFVEHLIFLQSMANVTTIESIFLIK